MSDQHRLPPPIFLLLENKRKNNNLGTELRCAVAFGVNVVVAVGFSQFADYGSHGAAKHVRVIAFPTTDQAVRYLKEDCACESFVGVLGCLPSGFSKDGYWVRIEDDRATLFNPQHMDYTDRIVNDEPAFGKSYSIADTVFSIANTVVVIGKEFEGLPLHLARHCDRFVHIPHLPATSAIHETRIKGEVRRHPVLLLNPASFLSITLYHLTEQLGYDEHSFQGHKFHVAALKKHRDERLAEELQKRRYVERQRLQMEAQSLMNDDGMMSLFASSMYNDDTEEESGDY